MTGTATEPDGPAHPAPGPDYPMERTCPYHMPPGYEPLRERGPLSRVTLYDGRQVWLVSGNAEGRALLLDPRLSVNTRHPAFPHLTERLTAQHQEQGVVLPMIGTDDPQHARQRRLVTGGLGIRRVAAMRPRIERIAHDLIDAMLADGDGAELVAAYTMPLASTTTYALLGVPPEDRPRLGELSRRALTPAGEEEAEAAPRAFAEICAYLHDLIEHKEHRPGDGLIDELIAKRSAGEPVDRDELIMICAVLMVGGNETTSTTIASSVLALLEHPDQRHQLPAEPELTADAVDELTRVVSVADALPRVATADIEIAGVTIVKGEGVIISTMLMNRDRRFWEDPDTVDIHRRAGRHVAFGFGIHSCVGQSLARAEMEIALDTLFRRVPTLRLAVPAEQVPGHAAHLQQGGVAALPVAW